MAGNTHALHKIALESSATLPYLFIRGGFGATHTHPHGNKANLRTTQKVALFTFVVSTK